MLKRIAQILPALALSTLAASCTPPSSHAPTDIQSGATAGIFQPKYLKAKNFGINGQKIIVLTFDDGPQRGVTDSVLDLLKREGIKASFFIEGDHVRGNEDLLQRMHDEGHVVANHTYTHRNLIKLHHNESFSSVYSEVAETDRLIAPYVRSDSRFYFRAPGGSFNTRGTTDATDYLNQYPEMQKYIGPVYWDIGGQITYVNADGSSSVDNIATDYIKSAADWDCWKKQISVATCTAAYKAETDSFNGGIILMHDHDIRTYEMVRTLIPIWKRAGYTFITMDEIPNVDQFQ